MKHEDVIKSKKDYDMLANIITKADDLIKYYGDTHASAEYFHKEFNYSLTKCRQILRYLKQQGVFISIREGRNSFSPNDPSKGFTDFNKPHAPVIAYYVINKITLKSLLPIWQKLSSGDPLEELLK